MAWWKEVRMDPMGEAAFILRHLGDWAPYRLAEALSGQPGISDVCASYETVGVYLSEQMSETALRNRLSTLAMGEAPASIVHEIPVCYELGDDLEEAATRLKLSCEEVIHLHSGLLYRCFAVGFQPGFPFLGYLSERLSGLPRRPSPRVAVPIGSVGIAGRQTGIYPSASPGGWTLIGRTPLTIVDVAGAYFPISAGDEVRFLPISPSEYERRLGDRL